MLSSLSPLPLSFPQCFPSLPLPPPLNATLFSSPSLSSPSPPYLLSAPPLSLFSFPSLPLYSFLSFLPLMASPSLSSLSLVAFFHLPLNTYPSPSLPLTGPPFFSPFTSTLHLLLPSPSLSITPSLPSNGTPYPSPFPSTLPPLSLSLPLGPAGALGSWGRRQLGRGRRRFQFVGRGGE